MPLQRTVVPNEQKNSAWTKNGTLQSRLDEMNLEVVFFRTANGREPVRQWLKKLPREDRRSIGIDLKTVQFGWPLGMPLVRKLESGIWEVRSNLDSRIARVLFTVIGDRMVLLHGFIKKAQKTPTTDLELARSHKADLEN